MRHLSQRKDDHLTDQQTASPESGIKVKIGLALATLITLPLAWLPARLGLALGAALGRLAFLVMGKRRRIAVANIEMIKANGSLPPDLDAAATARGSFANLGRSAWEAICFYHRGFEPFKKYCHVDVGREFFESTQAEARRTGKGLMLITGHFDNWELECQYLPLTFNLHLTTVGRTSGHPVADILTERLRTKNGNAFLSKKGGARDMIKVLKSGGAIGTLIDQAVIGNHVGAPVPFLGRIATTNLGPIRLARRSGAPIIMVLFRREGRHHFMKVCPPLQAPADLDGEEALMADAAQLNQWLGDHIKKYPDQWMWGHRRWKTREKVAEDADSIV